MDKNKTPIHIFIGVIKATNMAQWYKGGPSSTSDLDRVPVINIRAHPDTFMILAGIIEKSIKDKRLSEKWILRKFNNISMLLVPEKLINISEKMNLSLQIKAPLYLKDKDPELGFSTNNDLLIISENIIKQNIRTTPF